MERQRSVRDERGGTKGKKELSVAAMKVEVQLRTTAIPNGRGGKGNWPMTLCGFAYPLFSILERESLGSPLFPPTRDSYYRRRHSFFRPPFTLSRIAFRRSSFDSILPAEQTRLSPPPPFALSLLRRSLSIYLSPLLCRCAVRRVDPLDRVHKAHGFYYEIARASSRFTPYLSAAFPVPLALRTRRRCDIYWQTLRMSDHAGLRISGNIVLSYGHGSPYRDNPRIEKEREKIYIYTHSPITFRVFIAMRKRIDFVSCKYIETFSTLCFELIKKFFANLNNEKTFLLNF